MATAQTKIGPADHGRRMSPAEFLDAEEEPGYRYELARGVLEVTEVPNDPHGQIEDNLREMLSTYRREHPGLIRRIGGASAFRLWVPEMISGHNPDVALVLQGTPKDERGRRRPAWAAEVVSEGAEAREREYVTKREEYLAYGLREYWIIDPERRRVTVLARQETPGGPAWGERAFEGDETIVSVILPGFRGTVAGLWIDAELDDEDDEATA